MTTKYKELSWSGFLMEREKVAIKNIVRTMEEI